MMSKKKFSAGKCTIFFKIISILLLVFWLFVIFGLSNQSGTVSGNNSSRLIFNFLNYIYKLFYLNTDNLIDVVNKISNPLRELMHSLEYFILSILFINVLLQFKVKDIIIITAVFIFVSASFDEIHQLFVIGRSFQYFDIFMDMLGGVSGILIFKKFY